MQLGEQFAQLDRACARPLTVRATASSPLGGHRLINDIRAAFCALTYRAQDRLLVSATRAHNRARRRGLTTPITAPSCRLGASLRN